MEDKKNIHSLEEFKVSQYLAFVGPFLIFLGMLRLISFYNSFGISIISYLELSEALLSFFDIIIIVVIFIAYTSIQNFLASGKNDIDKVKKERQSILEENNFFKICICYLKYFSSLIILGFVIIAGFIVARFYFHWITTVTVFLSIAFFVLLLIFLILLVEIERKHIQIQSSLNKRRYIFFLLYFLLISYFVTLYSSYQAGQIRNKKSTYGVSIILDDNQTLVSDSSNYFIGKTLNYVFIHHEKENKTDIIPMSRVKQITMIHILPSK